MTRSFLIGFLIGAGYAANAQIPRVLAVEPLDLYPNGRILISGSGFSATPAQLQVWFDQVKGTIISSSSSTIEVVVPAQARLSNIEVINLSSGLSAKSSLKFMPSFSGEPFDPTKFTSPLSFPSPTEVWDMCACDFNNDGKPDMAVTKFFSPSNNFMMMQNQSTMGNVAFSKTDRSLTFPSDNAVCGDLNGDGKPELVISRSGASRNSIHVFRNTSAGTISFATPIDLFLEVGHFATRINIRDLNQDGKPELIVTNSFNNLLYIFQNTTSGGVLSFMTPPTQIPVANVGTNYGVEVQDFDGDGLPDIAINTFQSNDIFILRNQGGGSISFAAAQRITLTGTLNSITSADFNNDNKMDLVVTSTLNSRVHVLINTSSTGALSFAAPITLVASNGPWGLDVSDIDGDGDADVIVANRNQALLDVFLHDGNFSSPGFSAVQIATSKTVRNVKAADLDGDGKPDLALTTFNATLGTYSLDILRNQNCHLPKILNDQPLVICTGQTIRLQTIPANNVTFTWKKAGVTVKTGAEPFLDITAADTYTVTATGEAGACAVTSSPIVVTSSAGIIPSDPVINTNAPLCAGSNLTLSTAAVAGATYAWTGPNGFTSAQQNPVINNVTSSQAGFYTLQVSVGACKSNVTSYRVDVVDLDEVTITSSSAANRICQGSTLTLSVPSDPTYNYQWVKDGVDIGGQVANTLVVSQSGTYTVKIDVTGISCTRTATPVAVAVVVPPVAAFLDDSPACVGEVVTFTNQSTTDPLATPAYTWNFGDGNSSTTPSPTHAFSTAQSFSVALTASYSGVTGCTNTANKSVTITSSSPPVIMAADAEICPGESTTLSITGTYTSIAWNEGSTGSSISVNQPGTFSVTTLDANGCNGMDEIVILGKAVPDVQVSTSKSVVAPGESVQLEATGADSYVWTPAETLNDAMISNPTAEPLASTTYTAVGTLIGGCSGEGSILIMVDAAAITIKPLPAFSPNGDGSNDFWVIEGVEGYPDCELNIFDRRGRRVYQQKGYNSDWNGTYNESPVPAGTYFFVFGCPDQNSVTGSVLIFR